MDIQIRKQLEQLEYIKDKLEYIEYDEALGCYIEKQDGLPTGVAAWVNGAFYGFEQAAKAVPEGFVLAPVEEVKTWYLDDDESIYREDPDWLCNTPVGEVVEVERRISYELDQAPVFAAITWDEDNQDVGYYETFSTKDEAEKAAAHCKAMIEAQEPAND